MAKTGLTWDDALALAGEGRYREAADLLQEIADGRRNKDWKWVTQRQADMYRRKAEEQELEEFASKVKADRALMDEARKRRAQR